MISGLAKAGETYASSSKNYFPNITTAPQSHFKLNKKIIENNRKEPNILKCTFKSFMRISLVIIFGIIKFEKWNSGSKSDLSIKAVNNCCGF